MVRNEAGREKIKEMKVGRRLKSDHLPLEMVIKMESEGIQEEEKDQVSRKKIVWDEDGERRYRGEMGELKEVQDWEDLKEKIKRALPMKEIKK